MNTLAVNLSKEWREQRPTLAALALVSLAAVGVACACVPRLLMRDPLVAQWIVGLTVLSTVMSIGADLLPRERQRGLALLARIPHGLERAVRGKLCFFALALFGAFAYGSLLAAGASLARTGQLPTGSFGAAPLWLPLALAVSLWVFAVSSWMPNSALTLPAAALFLAVFAWPAALALTGGTAFRPTPDQAVAFVALCTAGAPVSAWASFVVGSRRGRSRARAALIGIAFAVPFFAPAWAWAGVRYHEHVTRPLSIFRAQLGTNPRLVFLDLATQSREETRGSRDDESLTAMIVDLELGAPKFEGPRDSSAFVEDEMFRRYDSFLGLAGCPRFTLYRPGADDPGLTFDGATGESTPSSRVALGPALPTPADFGCPGMHDRFSIRWAGCGQVMRFSDGAVTRTLYRDVERKLVVDGAALGRSVGTELAEVRIRPGRWLVHAARNWSWFDPIALQCAPLTMLGAKERLGPSLSDGRFLLTADDALWIFDPESNAREPVNVLGLEPGDVPYISTWHYGSAPIPVDVPTVVLVGVGPRALGRIDLGTRTLRASFRFGSRAFLELLRVDGPRVTLVEEQRQVVRYDLDRDTREVLFDVSSVK